MTEIIHKKLKFGECALKLGFMTSEKLDYVLGKHKDTRYRLGQICVEEKIISDEQMAQIIAEQYSRPYVELKEINRPELFNMVPFELMLKYQFVPYKREGNTLIIAMIESLNFQDAADELERLINMDISIVVASEKRIRHHLQKKKLRFGDWAIKLGFMTHEDLDYILSKKGHTNRLIGQLCLQEGFIDNEQLARIIAAQYSYNYLELKEIKDLELFKRVPAELMMKHKFIPYEKRKNTMLVVAIADPLNFLKIADELEILLDMDLFIVVASEKKITELLKKYESSQNVLDSVSDDMRLPLVKESDKGEDVLSVEKVSAEESKTVKIVNSTILDAINKKASDIHIESSGQGVIIRYRIDGMLHQATEPLDIQYQNSIISRIKVMSELDITEKRIPQDGRFKLKVHDRYIDFRISILPTIFGENAVIRILDSKSMKSDTKKLPLDCMDLPESEIKRIRRMVHAPYGMFLMSGPTGSGKTTTLYKALSEANSSDIKIITIEDPVEYQLQGVVQIPVNEKKGLTFAKGLRSILRHDPDKILVGEIRDSETAEIALQSALTGHLVFTTVHANKSFEVINRFVHMGIEVYNLMSALNCIVAQRLIRSLCPRCKQRVILSEEEIKRSNLLSIKDLKILKTNSDNDNNYILYNSVGCKHCNGTGYSGRKAIIELVELDDEMRELFIQRASVSVLKEKAEESGSVFLREAAMIEVKNGNTTLNEANRVTFME
ncbi:type IV pilus assembly protein PilB [Candidatus Magnetomoraceae bacterium gMMP-15]